KMNLIEGIKIEVTSAELRTMLEERRDHHKAKHAFYLEQVQNLTKGGVGESTASNCHTTCERLALPHPHPQPAHDLNDRPTQEKPRHQEPQPLKESNPPKA